MPDALVLIALAFVFCVLAALVSGGSALAHKEGRPDDSLFLIKLALCLAIVSTALAVIGGRLSV